MVKKVFIKGRDNVGWSIDTDRYNLEKCLKDLKIEIAKNIFEADIIHSVLWESLLSKYYLILKKLFFKNKKIIATANNFIALKDRRYDRQNFDKVNQIVDLWLAPNKKQEEIFKQENIPVKYFPYHIDENRFKFLNKDKKDICKILKIDYELIKEKFLIGSFQRDSLGLDQRSFETRERSVGPTNRINCSELAVL